MRQDISTRSSSGRGTLSIILLIILLTQAGWVMYSSITEFEVDIDHSIRSPDGILGLGLAAGGELIGIILILARYNVGFMIAIASALLRVIISLLPDLPFDGMAVIGIMILSFLGVHFAYDDTDTEYSPTNPDIAPSITAGAPTGKLDVFLSYSRSQFYFAESLMLRLEGNAVSVWFDTHRIQAGTDWKDSIDRGLSACASMVLVLSRDALASENVDYEWRTALEHGKRLYVVLFEAVDPPPELSREAVAIIDMRTRFTPKVRTLLDLLARPRHHRDRTPTGDPLRLPLRRPPVISLTTITLVLVFATSLFFDFLNARTLIAIITPNDKNIPEEVPIDYTTHLLGVTLHGMGSKVDAFLGICVVTLLLTILTAYLLTAILYRRRFVLGLLPLTLLGSCWLYLNTSFIEHSTNHIVVSTSGGLMMIPANTNSTAWRDIDDMLLAKPVDDTSFYSFEHGSPFLSVGDEADYLTATGAQWRLLTLLLLALAVIAFVASRRSGSFYRWLATGVAPERLRFRHNRDLPPTTQWTDVHRGTVAARRPRWRLLHHPADSQIAAEVETALTGWVSADSEGSPARDVAVVLLTNHVRLDWLEEVERDNADLIYVVCTNIRQAESLRLLRQRQWFDYRERSYDKLILLARSVQRGSSTGAAYSFPPLPEKLTRTVLPVSVQYKSHAMRLCATWLLAVTLLGQGRLYSSFVQDEGIGRLFPVLVMLMFWICIPCCLHLFWLAVELTSARITYTRFRRHLNAVMIVLFVTQLQFLLSFDDQVSTVLLGALLNAFLVTAWLTPDAAQLRRWLPADSGRTSGAATLAVPVWSWPTRASMIYPALFVFCYWSGLMFFADAS